MEKQNDRSESNQRKKEVLNYLFDFNHLFLIAILAILLCLALSSCDSQSDGQPVPPTPVPKPNPSTKLSAEVKPLAEANHYLVRLTWQTNEQASDWIVYRKGSNGVLQELGKADAAAKTHDDPSVTIGERYTYYLASVDGAEPVFKSSVVVDIPRDLEIHGQYRTKELVGINRLFLSKDAVIVTEGQDFRIEAQEILSDGGSILTFSSGQKALSSKDGRSGGFIKVVARRAKGSLRIEGRGETAGDGMDGTPGQNGNAGPTGNPGKWGMNQALYKVFFPSFIDSFKAAMERNPKPPGDPEWNYTFGNMRRFVCAVPPTDGGPGSDGTNGLDGGGGGNGGDSAKIYVEIKENEGFEIVPSTEVGLSGIGGRGGKGGTGGPGGQPGPLDQGHLCAPAKQGPRGKDGVDGRQGRPGQMGVKQPVCIKLSPEVIGNCDKF
jgi:hypothetical protein